jgi:hypothetical protein
MWHHWSASPPLLCHLVSGARLIISIFISSSPCKVRAQGPSSPFPSLPTASFLQLSTFPTPLDFLQVPSDCSVAGASRRLSTTGLTRSSSSASSMMSKAPSTTTTGSHPPALEEEYEESEDHHGVANGRKARVAFDYQATSEFELTVVGTSHHSPFVQFTRGRLADDLRTV